MKRFPLRFLVLALAGLPLMAGCRADDEQAREITGPQPGGELFARYVAIGNSITAGFQSSGINDSTQLRAYPVLLARQANAVFEVPLLNKPGCPPPFIGPLGQGGGVGGPTAPACSLRTSPAPQVVQNLAVPGALLGDALTQTRSADPNSLFNRLQFFFLGGQTMLEAAVRARPSLVSVWLGNNDILGAVLAGNTALLTPEATFNTQLDSLVRGLRSIPTLRDVAIIGVVDASIIPLYQPGAYFFLSRDAAGRFQGKPVNNNCSPVTPLGQPNPLSRNQVSFAIVSNASFPEINCDENAYPVGDPRRGALVLSVAEQTDVSARTNAFNNALQQRAQANGWIYLDPNITLRQLANERDAQGRYQRLRRCQALATAQTPAQLQTAVLTSCPVPAAGATAPFAAPNFFGSLMSFDGVHPSSEGHVVVANLLIDQINAKHTLQIPRL
ncbi:MAG TPA: SGNH/GDSL hydrolase family protein [Longimicrobiaceae bacterium]|nr:SGNH/GDSL hydrolase family protein [Longimicrobiaceae bacterium]